MTLLQQVSNMITNKTDEQIKEIVVALQDEAKIIECQVQEKGDGLYIRYDSKSYFNFCHTTPILLKHGLIVYAFDYSPSGTCNVWLRTIESFK